MTTICAVKKDNQLAMAGDRTNLQWANKSL